MPSFGSFLPRLKPGAGTRVDEKCADAAVLELRLGHHEGQDIVCDRPAGNPRLAAVQHVELAVADGAAAHASGI